MQLELVNGVEGEGQQQGPVVNNGGGGGKDKGPTASCQYYSSESHAYAIVFVFVIQQSVSDLRKFSASSSSSQPLPPHISSRLNTEIERFDESDGNNTDPETKEEWLDSSQLVELSCRFRSRMSEAMATEVLLKHSLHPHTHS